MLPKAALTLTALAISPVLALWPIPTNVTLGNQTLWIDESINVTYNGNPVWIHSPSLKSRQETGGSHHQDSVDGGVSQHIVETNLFSNHQQLSYVVDYAPPSGKKFNSQDIVQGGVERAFTSIFKKGLNPWMLRERGSDYEPKCDGKGPRVSKLNITQTGKDSEATFKPTAGSVDESYSLKVNAEGAATLEAVSSTGILRGLETFQQLFFLHSNGSHYTNYVPVNIKDAPVYPHRGILLDVSRHWFPIDEIKRTIDALAMAKLNVLHLHITDTQSWPVEIPALPKLAEKGSYANGLTYSPEDIAGLYEYGIHRGVQVIMEIDMPGHIGIEEAYPGLSVAFKEKPYQWYCAQPPCGAFKLNSTEVEGFLDTLFDDLLPRINPYSAYFHTGGDEYKANNSLLDPALRTNDVAVLQPMLQRFLDHAHDKVREHGLVPFVWEEMLLEWNATLGKDVIIQSWLGNSAIKKIAEGGHKVIDSTNAVYYLDCGRGQWLDFPDGPSWNKFYPFADWCSPAKNWKLLYSHDPRDGVPKAVAGNVLGGELAVWTETIDMVSLDTIIWPRANAAAEVWWSGRKDAAGKNRTQTEARPRLSEQRERMLKRGIQGTPITQLWCEMNGVENCSHIE